MAVAKHLTNAPITEAIFDFQVKARPGLRGEDFEEVYPHLRDQFPQRGQSVHKRIVASTEGQTTVEDFGITGFVCADEHRLSTAQFRVDGFTFNRLHPYTSWENLFPIMLGLWDRYVRIAEPEYITRLAVRYINRIALPNEPVELLDYLVSAPIVPDGLPQYIKKFMTRVTMHDEDISYAAHVAQIYGPSSQGRDIILDIDAFCVKNRIETHDAEIPDIFDHLRAYKNTIFFLSLTDKALEPYQ